MKKILAILLVLAALIFPALAEEPSYAGVDLINSTNWVKYFDGLLGYPYDSHGCLHFSPSDIYLLYKTIPPGLPLTIKGYKLRESDLSFVPDKVPYLADLTAGPQDVEKHAALFKTYKTEIVVYPSLNLLFILVNGALYARVKALAGLPFEYQLPADPVLLTPTDPGEYTVLGVTDHYLSATYYENTIIPFGAWLKKINGAWFYQENGKWYKLPANVTADLARPAGERNYNYYDLNVDGSGELTAARYAGHDFGKYALLWTADGKNRYPELGYAAGELVFEQIMLVKNLVYLLTVPGPDDFETCAAQNSDFMFYKALSEFKTSRGKVVPAGIDPILLSYYRLFNGYDLSDEDSKRMDPRMVKAFSEYNENRLPREKQARQEALGHYEYLRINSLLLDKQAGWFEKVKADWEMLRDLRVKLRADFERLGIMSLENRQNIVENWLNERLEFKKVVPPGQAKYSKEVSFTSFFRPDEENKLFTERERAVMVESIRRATRGEGQALSLNIVDALNNYNFGLLLNDILGDLYKSHGCLHASPRNINFLYTLLPLGAEMQVYPYSKTISAEAIASIPYLADLVNFSEDLEKLKEKFTVPKDIKIAVYPATGEWIIYLKDQPFARLTVKGGPQTKFYLVQGREKNGRPIFQAQLAYPTTAGDYYIFKKVENYVSSIYYDQTIIPMSGVIKNEAGRWFFQDREGKRRSVPGTIAADLKRPEEEREYTYFDKTLNASGEVLSLKWGSHPFGRFALQTTVDHRTAWPELIHSSGDLMMEERQLVNDLIALLTAPCDEVDDCVKTNRDFELYKACYEFTLDPGRMDLIQPKERAAYRLYFNLPLTTSEAALLPPDVVVAAKLLRKQALTAADTKVLVDEGIAYRRSGKLKINMEKILGLQFDTYQYVVTIQKYAHHYATLKRRWGELSGLRRALLKDFNAFVIRDQRLFSNFMRELMLKRTALERLTQDDALKILNGML